MPRPTLSQEKIDLLFAHVSEGFCMNEISKRVGVPYSTVAKYVKIFKDKGYAPKETKGRTNDPVTKALRDETIKARLENITSSTPKPLALSTPPPTSQVPAKIENVPATLADVEERLETLAGKMVVGAEKLAASIANMTEMELSTVPLQHRAAALGTLVDKIKSITNKNQDLVATVSGANLSIIQIISSSIGSRKKDAVAEVEAEDIMPEPEDNPEDLLQ